MRKAVGKPLTLALFVLLSLAACGSEEKESTPSDKQTGPAAPAASEPTKIYKTNDVVEYDSWTVTVLRVQPKWVSESAKASAGSRLVAVELQVTNKAQMVRNSPIPGLCTLVQSPGAEHLGLLVVAGPTPALDRSNIPPNQTRTGWATFQSADMEGLLLQCEPDPDTNLIWNLGS